MQVLSLYLFDRETTDQVLAAGASNQRVRFEREDALQLRVCIFTVYIVQQTFGNAHPLKV